MRPVGPVHRGTTSLGHSFGFPHLRPAYLFSDDGLNPSRSSEAASPAHKRAQLGDPFFGRLGGDGPVNAFANSLPGDAGVSWSFMGRAAVIVGSTASGKSALALAVARLLRSKGQAVEIVCVDSMTVYRGMDIGTTKPSATERVEFPHHLLDLLDPCEEMSLSVFQSAAQHVLDDVATRGATPVLVGGTGLYVDAVVNGLTIPARFPATRAQLEADLVCHGVEGLHAQLVMLDPVAATRMEPTNERRILRALEVTIGSGRPFSTYGPGLDATRALDDRYALFGVRWERDLLRQRISHRFAALVAAGFVEECRELLATYGASLSRTAAQALGYREIWAYLRGEIPLDAALAAAVLRTQQFAVRQERWFRRDLRIQWIDAAASLDATASLDAIVSLDSAASLEAAADLIVSLCGTGP
jgi:tRNA dimethylallyltransferase